MHVLNVEIKTRINNPKDIESILLSYGADYKGTDHQTDHYFNVKQGKLKLRRGNIENTLIQYHRPESKDLKTSTVRLQFLPSDNEALQAILEDSIGLRSKVSKARKIFFIDNVKFHIDQIEQLGDFLEIEAISMDGAFTQDQLSEQCNKYIDLLKLNRNNFIDKSYVDLIEALNA